MPDTQNISIDQFVIDKLKLVSTATLATALYKRGFRSQTVQGVYPLGLIEKSMVGLAYTLRYIPAREDLNRISVFTDPKHPQRAAIEACPPGAVLVMDSRGDARATSAGGILVRRLMRGAATSSRMGDSATVGNAEKEVQRRAERDAAVAD